MDKKLNSLLLFLLAFLVAFLVRYLKVSSKYVALEDILSINQQISDMQISVQNTKNQTFQIQEKYNDTMKKLMNYNQTIEDMQTELDQYMMYSGYKNVYGEGVVVIIDDADRLLIHEEDPANLMVHDLDLRMIINELQNAGAEAISVNGIRVNNGINKVVCQGPTISINGVDQAQPYIIRAIGDRFKLSKVILSPYSTAKSLIDIGLNIQVNTNKYIEITGITH